MRIKFVLICRFNQAVDYRDRLCVCRRIGKEPVLPAHHERFYAALSTVIAQLQSRISALFLPASHYRKSLGDLALTYLAHFSLIKRIER